MRRAVQADRSPIRAKAATQATVGGNAAAKKTTRTMHKTIWTPSKTRPIPARQDLTAAEKKIGRWHQSPPRKPDAQCDGALEGIGFRSADRGEVPARGISLPVIIVAGGQHGPIGAKSKRVRRTGRNRHNVTPRCNIALDATVVAGSDNSAPCDNGNRVITALCHGYGIAPHGDILAPGRLVSRSDHMPVSGEGDGMQISRRHRVQIVPCCITRT